MIASSEPKAIDLFCGCGGISAGLRDAGFEVLAGVDIERKRLSTFQRNFREARSLHLDLTKYTPTEVMAELGIEPGELDLLAGGPPCQGFSKNVPRKLRRMDDTNNLLVRSFLEYCEIIGPRLILMENVAEMKNGFSRQFSDEIMARLCNAGYAITAVVLNAAEYGVPQRRRRAFFLAAKGTTPAQAPTPTHGKDSPQIGLLDSPNFVTVWEAIGDLPSVCHGEGEDPCEYNCEPFSDYQRNARSRAGMGIPEFNDGIAERLQSAFGLSGRFNQLGRVRYLCTFPGYRGSRSRRFDLPPTPGLGMDYVNEVVCVQNFAVTRMGQHRLHQRSRYASLREREFDIVDKYPAHFGKLFRCGEYAHCASSLLSRSPGSIFSASANRATIVMLGLRAPRSSPLMYVR